jgi:hypothetical protein
MKGYWVEVVATARVRTQVYVKEGEARDEDSAKQAALRKIVQGDVTNDAWHVEGGDHGHVITKVRRG